MSERIGIYGGTFDPIHLGHLHAAQSLLAELELLQLNFVPAYQPVHRDKPQASTEQRLSMLSLAISEQPRFALDDREIVRGGPSYSLLTCNEYALEYPQAQLFFIVGSDAFQAIDSWHQWQKLFDIVNFVVLARPGFSLTFNESVSDFIETRMTSSLTEFVTSAKGKIYLSEQPMMRISATEVRAAVDKQQSITQLVPEKVANFIKQHTIYSKVLLK